MAQSAEYQPYIPSTCGACSKFKTMPPYETIGQCPVFNSITLKNHSPAFNAQLRGEPRIANAIEGGNLICWEK